jgi:acetyl-CoA synthetase
VESALIEHPAVAEAAVVGRPDPERTEVVVAHVVLRPGREVPQGLAGELQDLVRRRVGAHAYPREVEFAAELPKTPSGKIQRHLLRAGGHAPR